MAALAQNSDHNWIFFGNDVFFAVGYHYDSAESWGIIDRTVYQYSDWNDTFFLWLDMGIQVGDTGTVQNMG